jgi:nucleotide-binding universal stress UspA family protein
MEANYSYKNILVPMDFTESCINALGHAIEMARLHASKIFILHVLEGKNATDESYMFGSMEKMTEIIDSLDYDQVEPVLKSGDIFTTINEVAVDKAADLVVLGTHGKKGIQKFIGSYALKVIDSTKLPVIVVQSSAKPTPLKTIVFPVDSNEEDRQKSNFAVVLAKAYGAAIHVLPKAEKTESAKQKASNVMKQIRSFMDKYSVEVQVVENNDTSTDFAKIVLAYSESVKANLILILSDASHLPLIGAKEEDFMFNSSSIPVMCVTEKQYKSAKFSVVG